MLYLIVEVCYVFGIMPHLPKWAPELQAALVFYNVIMLTLSVAKNPGYISPGKGS